MTNMIYVMSDIHGEYKKYIQMLELINFSDEDELYILGDVVDRGDEPVKVLLDMMKRPNVFPLMGNHDLLALDVLRKISVDITENNFATQIDISVMNEMLDWLNNGGATTMEDFRKLDKTERTDVLNYISDFPLCEIAETDDKTFILVHAGLGNFRPDKKLRDYTPEELISSRNNPDIQYFSDDSIYIVSGHTPTINTTGKPEIYINCNNLNIDCGAVFGGKLGCLRLNDMKEFYI